MHSKYMLNPPSMLVLHCVQNVEGGIDSASGYESVRAGRARDGDASLGECRHDAFSQ